ncbi:MAG TPA: hypothetical protein PLE50_13250, partial [Rhabdaerophilum sp.]|nr:hypothetical protein [Rhabdaerophilum sp.]
MSKPPVTARPSRRFFTGSLLLGVPALGAFGYAAQTGRIDVLTPLLPENGDLPGIPGVLHEGQQVEGLQAVLLRPGVGRGRHAGFRIPLGT